MGQYSKILVLTLVVMAAIFSTVLIFKGELNKERRFIAFIAKEKLKEKITKEEKIEWQPSKISHAPVIVPQEILSEKHFETIDRRGFVSGMVEIEKDRFNRKIIADDLIVTFKRNTDPLEVERIEDTNRLLLKYYNPSVGVAHFKIPVGHSMTQEELEQAIPIQAPFVIAAEPNLLLESDTLSDLPSEHKTAWLWYFYNNGQPKKFSFFSGDITVTPKLNFDIFMGQLPTPWSLWNQQTSCGQSLVSVVDSGFDRYHMEFSNRYDLTKAKNVKCASLTHDSISSHLSSDQTNCYAIGEHIQLLKNLADVTKTPDAVRKDTEKTMIHGHHVSATIAAIMNNDKEGAGLCPQSKIIPILMGSLAIDPTDPQYPNKVIYIMSSLDGANGIETAANSGAKVINASWGTNDAVTYTCSGNTYPAPCHIVSAIEYARSKNVLVVFAAGNMTQDNDVTNRSPTNLSKYFDNVLSIAASSPNGMLWKTSTTSGSNYGVQSVNLIAPGEFIYTPNYSNTFIGTIPPEYNTKDRSNSTGYFSIKGSWTRGTSLAAPITSAIAGIIYNALITKFGVSHPLDQYNYAKAVKDILLQTSDKNSNSCPDKDKVSSGCLNAYEALNLVDTMNSSILQTWSGSTGISSGGSSTTTTPTTTTPAPSSGSQSITSEGEDGGGCGFIDDTNSHNTPSSNWPILVLYLMSFLMLIRQRWNSRHRQLSFVRGSSLKDHYKEIK